MNTWNGNININGNEIEVWVDYKRATQNRLGEWSGYGYLTKCLDVGSYKTNIGTIIINNITINPGKYYFTFVGSESPKGELKLIMG